MQTTPLLGVWLASILRDRDDLYRGQQSCLQCPLFRSSTVLRKIYLCVLAVKKRGGPACQTSYLATSVIQPNSNLTQVAHSIKSISKHHNCRWSQLTRYPLGYTFLNLLLMKCFLWLNLSSTTLWSNRILFNPLLDHMVPGYMTTLVR